MTDDDDDDYGADDLLTRLHEVKAVCKKARREPSRFHDYPYLQAVYDFYSHIRSKELKDLAVTVIRDDLSVSINRDTHLIRAIIDATCKADRKIKSRWTRALRYAWKQRDHWDRLPRFFRRNGGISGCASWFTETRRWQRPKTNRIKLPSDVETRLIKRQTEVTWSRLSRPIQLRIPAKPIIVHRRYTVGDFDRSARKEPNR